MNDRRSSSDLGSGAENALSTFPFPERDWEADARAIEARIGLGGRGSTDARLLAAPLPNEADEPSSLSATATPLTNSGVRTQSLAELARRSVEKKQSQERQMARESLALAAQQRQRPVAHDASAARSSQDGRAPAATQIATERAPHAESKPLPKVALALPVLALAAGALFWFSHPEPAPSLTGVAPATWATIAPEATAASSVARNQPNPTEELPRGVDPNSLPDQGLQSGDGTGKVAAASGAVASAAPGKVGAGKPTLKAPPGGSDSKGATDDLPTDPGLRPADSRGGELPVKPTTGAVQVALGAVMSGARHCVAGDDAPSRAVVVFGSDGRVQSVTVSGAAAGKSSGSCIEAQLSRARVQPFAASSFSVNATVRPE